MPQPQGRIFRKPTKIWLNLGYDAIKLSIMTETLPEIPADEAPPEIKAIYDQIMTLTGVGSPALIYRYYAVFPGLLEWVWDIIGPELKNGYLVREAPDAIKRMKAIDLPKISRQDLTDCGLTASDIEALSAMFATYNRMNPVNLALNAAILKMLASDVDRSTDVKALPPAARVEPATTMKLPAPIKLGDMDQSLQEIVIDISSAIPNTSGVVIPTLYRHVAIWPDLMRLMAPGIATAIASGNVDTQMSRTTDVIAPFTQEVVGRALARNIGPAPIPDPAKLVETLESFLITIPQLIVLGTALDRTVETQP